MSFMHVIFKNIAIKLKHNNSRGFCCVSVFRYRDLLYRKISNNDFTFFCKHIKATRRTSMANTLKLFDVASIDSHAYIESIRRYPVNKLSYVPALYKGLARVKKKLPFKSEVVFFGQRHAICTEIRRKLAELKHPNQR